jgi:hypothetical protein
MAIIGRITTVSRNVTFSVMSVFLANGNISAVGNKKCFVVSFFRSKMVSTPKSVKK